MRQASAVMPPWAALLSIGAVVLLVSGGVISAWLMLRDAPTGGATLARNPADVTSIQTVEQTLIRRDAEGLRRNAEARHRLDEYEWIDRDRGIVRIPIRRAMEMVVGAG